MQKKQFGGDADQTRRTILKLTSLGGVLAGVPSTALGDDDDDNTESSDDRPVDEYSPGACLDASKSG